MRRRDLLKASAAAAFTITAAPRLGRGDRAKTLVFVGVADLSVLDPVVTGARPTRNYKPVAEIVGSGPYRFLKDEHVSGARAGGLHFHDNEPVLARDVVASIRRFAPRVIFANALMDATDELSAPDDRTVRFRLKRPFPHLPEALVGPGGNVPAIMPERLASESPFIRRRNNQGPPDKGGYHMFCTLIDRSLPNVHPLGNLAIRADGKEPINGWANSPRIEELRAAWLDTADLEQQKRI